MGLCMNPYLMKSSFQTLLPRGVRGGIQKLGSDLAIARRKRGLTIAMMMERLGISKGTYRRMEQGDPKVAFGIYAMALQVLGLGDRMPMLADPGQDELGLAEDQERLPKRVRVRKDKPL